METYATLIHMCNNFHKKNKVHDFDISTRIYHCVIYSIFSIFSQNKTTLTKCNKCKITITHLYARVITPVSFCKEVDVKQYPSVTQVKFLSAQISQWHSNPKTINTNIC